jgi:hypothetical protein
MKIIKITIAFVILFSLPISLQAQINMKGITKKTTKEIEKPITDNSYTMSNNQTQDEDYKGAAKMEVKTFWRQAEFFKNGKGSASNLSNMENALVAIKQKDPSYSTISMESEINTWKEKISQENTNQLDKEKQQTDKITDRRNASGNKVKVENYFHEMFELKAMSFNVSELPGVEAKINAFKEKGEELLVLDFGIRDRQNKDIKRFFTHIDYYAFNTNKRLDQIEAVRAKSGYNDKDAIAQAYWEMQYFNVFWDIVHKLFPQETEYTKMLEKSNDVSKKNGSIAQIKSSTANSKVEENKNRRLPAAVASDPVLEKLAIETFNKYLGSEFKGTANKAIMMQKDWSSYLADITGAILGRKIQVAIVYKGTDGKCYVATGIILKQDYIGGTFKNTSAADARLSGGELPCEFAK